MATLIECSSMILNTDDSTNMYTGIEMQLNLISGYNVDYCPLREDYLNWIPFEFKLKIDNSEIYTYEIDDRVSLNLAELRYFFNKMDCFINKIHAAVPEPGKYWLDEPIKVDFFSCEQYFGFDFEYTESNTTRITVWVISRKDGGFERGFRYVVKIKDVQNFLSDLKEQLESMLK